MSVASAVTGVDAGGPAGRSKDSRITSPLSKEGGERGRRERRVLASGAFARTPLSPPTDESVPLFLFGETRRAAIEPLATEIVSRARFQLPL